MTFFSIFVNDRNREQRRIKRYRSCQYQSFLENVARVIGEGIQKNMFLDVDQRKVAAMLVEASISVIFQRLFFSDKLVPVERDAELITDVFLNGIQRKV